MLGSRLHLCRGTGYIYVGVQVTFVSGYKLYLRLAPGYICVGYRLHLCRGTGYICVGVQVTFVLGYRLHLCWGTGYISITL